ncbi:MAG: hypothetical protein KDB53_14955, partial [Planctomycetes bacterium]|nr:hypothetical protein [Planctomycetota bacterium]
MRSLLAVFVVASSLVIGQTKAPFDEALWAGMKARALGPATMSGRVAAIDVQPGTPRTIWVGAATGGLWRSRDLGLSFECVSDDWSAHSIGAVAVHQGQPQVIWVGMGEANPRNSAGWGLGVQLSTNGGETFHYVGLANTYNIARIIPDPRDARAAWVAALGNQWADSDDRGIYRTEDGGRTWTHQLALGPSVGAADLVIDPENPDHLLAAMWDFRREPHSFRSGGPGGGLHRSRDGGKSWDKLGTKEGLPKGDLGRIGLAFAPSNSRVVYAWVEATKENVLMRSDDGARSFRVVGRGDDIGNRPFYYADIHVDPKNPEVVYSLWSQVSRSTDGGKSFEVLIGWDDAHPDHHAFWIDPADPSFLIDGNDGGVAISRDRGENWRFVRTLPLAQLYHVRVDDALPYNIYFGLQDNGSWRGPAYTFEVGGIKNHHWRELCFGDGFDTAPVGDGRRGFAMSQEGHLVRWDLETGEQKSVRPLGPRDTDLRFNWNAGFAPDPFDDDTIWFGSQFVHRSKDLGDTWEIVSGDLTTNDPRYQRQKDSGGLTPDVTGAENYTTIVAIAPSPVEPGTVWVGSDDGRLHVSRDDGATWTSLETRLVGPPPGAWIPHIEGSPHAAGTAFICVQDHRPGKQQAWVLRTDDFGAT